VSESLNWAILVVAGASLIFALLAYRTVMRTTGRIDGLLSKLPSDITTIISPQFVGDAIHHALMRDEGAIMQEAAEHANGIVASNLPVASKLLAEEAINAVSVMTTPGQARALQGKSGAAKGYLNLGGSVQRQAVKTGVEGMAGGALGEIMDHPIYGPIAQQFIGNAMAKMAGGNGAPGGQPQPGPSNPQVPLLGKVV
jgi:hypothetical protein